MLPIYGSKAEQQSRDVKRSPRKGSEDNLKWLQRHWPKEDGRVAILLVGGSGPIPFRLRIAQAYMRHDLSPSHWSHVALIPGTKKGPGAAEVIEINLEPAEGFGDAPSQNGLQIGRLAQYKDEERFPNVALLQTGVPSEAIGERELGIFRRQRSALNAVALLHAWLGYVWGLGNMPNPLQSELGMPSAAAVETLLTAAGVDLTPGIAARSSCPEAFWQAAKWWHALPEDPTKDDQFVARRKMVGAYCVEHVLGKPEHRHDR